MGNAMKSKSSPRKPEKNPAEEFEYDESLVAHLPKAEARKVISAARREWKRAQSAAEKPLRDALVKIEGAATIPKKRILEMFDVDVAGVALRPLVDRMVPASGLRILTCSSAKAMHSFTNTKWVNAILYGVPSDAAFLPLVHHFGWEVALKAAEAGAATLPAMAGHEKHWRPVADKIRRYCARLKKVSVDQAMDFVRRLQERRYEVSRKLADLKAKREGTAPIYRKTAESALYLLPYAPNKFPLNLCPFASPRCRQTCLNTSGQGGQFGEMDPSKPRPILWGRQDDWMLHGIVFGPPKGRFGQRKNADVTWWSFIPNTPQDIRMVRTHLMLLAWAIDGSALRNRWIDLVQESVTRAKRFQQKNALVGDLKFAFRPNGTSDIPWQLARCTDGSSPLVNLGKLGVVCYDYTKDTEKYLAWMAARAWKGTGKDIGKVVVDRDCKLSKGWPTNYHLTYSAAENNMTQVARILQAGGNVAMVVRRSLDAADAAFRKKVASRLVRLSKSRKAGTQKSEASQTWMMFRDFDMPKHLDLTRLGKAVAAYAAPWAAKVPVVDADYTDMRFTDPDRVGKGVGTLCLLTPKGFARDPYHDKDRVAAYKRFCQAVESGPGAVTGTIRRNPGPVEGDRETGSVLVVDPALLEEAVRLGDGFEMMPNNLGC